MIDAANDTNTLVNALPSGYYFTSRLYRDMNYARIMAEDRKPVAGKWILGILGMAGARCLADFGRVAFERSITCG